MFDQRNIFQQLLQDLSDSLGIQDLRLDTNDSTQITLDGNIPINLFWKDEVEQMVAFAVVGYADDQLDNREELFHEILNAQFFWHDLRGFTLALEPETDLLVIMDKRQPLFFTEEDALKKYLENMAEVVQIWRGKLTEHAGDAFVGNNPYDSEEDNTERFAALMTNWLHI